MAISNRKRLLFLLLLVLIAFGLYRYLAKPEVKGPPEMTVPVSVARAIAQDVPHYLQGIGTVQASADVLVTSRVGGTLMDPHGHLFHGRPEGEGRGSAGPD